MEHKVYDIAAFTHLCFCCVYNKKIVFKNAYFETHFQKIAFSGQQNTTVMKMNGQKAKQNYQSFS